MKKLVFALGLTFAVATSYISLDTREVAASSSTNRDTLAAPVKLSTPGTETKSLSYAQTVFQKINFSHVYPLNFDVFEKALKGFENLKKSGKISAEAHLLTICDFSLSSNVKRLWVINTEDGEVLFNSLVAHGKNTGEEYASHFSNTENSLQSSLGFYVTDTAYDGENGYSLKLLGMDRGYNDHALQRAIVLHGADYVSEEFAAQHKRIGRSWGCPAVPRHLALPLINTIKGHNVLFVYYPDENYLNTSPWLNS